jgi:hypothetical protein
MPSRIVRLSKEELTTQWMNLRGKWLHVHLYSGLVYLLKPVEILPELWVFKDTFGHVRKLKPLEVYQMDYEKLA